MANTAHLLRRQSSKDLVPSSYQRTLNSVELKVRIIYWIILFFMDIFYRFYFLLYYYFGFYNRTLKFDRKKFVLFDYFLNNL